MSIAINLPDRPLVWAFDRHAGQRARIADFAAENGGTVSSERSPDGVTSAVTVTSKSGSILEATSSQETTPNSIKIGDHVTLPSGAELSRETLLERTDDGGFARTIALYGAQGRTCTLAQSFSRSADGVQVESTLKLPDGKTITLPGFSRAAVVDLTI